MARKKDEQTANRSVIKKTKKLQKAYKYDDENFASFSLQLSKLGLQVREIPGDGNCLFRALGDQIEGHCRGHLENRKSVIKFMIEHRKDFEPFIEDNQPFEIYIQNLSCPGTYAGNDVIVAFTRLHQLTVIIHQLNSPIWEINGTDKKDLHQIHISYHNGDHYSSVRCSGDCSETPTKIKIMNGHVVTNRDETVNKKAYHGFSENIDEEAYHYLKNVAVSAGSYDDNLLQLLWEENYYDFDSTLVALRKVMSLNSPSNQSASDSDESSNKSVSSGNSATNTDCATANQIKGAKMKKISKRNRKKILAEERGRYRIQAGWAETDLNHINQTNVHSDVATIINSGFKSLQI